MQGTLQARGPVWTSTLHLHTVSICVSALCGGVPHSSLTADRTLPAPASTAPHTAARTVHRNNPHTPPTITPSDGNSTGRLTETPRLPLPESSATSTMTHNQAGLYFGARALNGLLHIWRWGEYMLVFVRHVRFVTYMPRSNCFRCSALHATQPRSRGQRSAAPGSE